MRHGPIRISG